MNENLNLVEILKDCPKGTKLYSTAYGDVELVNVSQDKGTLYPIVIKIPSNSTDTFTCERSFDKDDTSTHERSFDKNGRIFADYSGECLLFPSRNQRDWSKFKIKKVKFDPKTLQPFDKVLVRSCGADKWKCAHFSYMEPSFMGTIYVTSMLFRDRIHYNDNCIPYNDDTKHLVGTTDEAPEFYRYWED